MSKVLVVEEGGRNVLAVPTGVSASDFVRSEIGSLQKESGWIVGDQGIRPWQIRGFTQHAGQIHFWGDHHPGVRLEDCLDEPIEANLARLKSLTGALLALAREKIPVFPLRTDGIYFLEDRSVLFMPPGIMQRIAVLRPFPERVRTYNVINNPDLSGPKTHSFSVGALLYRMLLGRYPFHGEDDISINSQIRDLRITPPALSRPEIVAELSETIVRSLDRAGRDAPEMGVWDAVLFRALTQGHRREVSLAERTAAEGAAREHDERGQRIFRRRVFFQKHWRLMAIVGSVLVVVGSVVGSILSNVFAPPVTRGYTPRQVTEAFYDAMNDLDHTTMEDATVDRAGAGEINEAMNLFVMSRVTMGYEGVSYIVSAKGWDERGRPEISPRETLYGAIIREVVEEQGEPQPVYRVRYEKWAPASESSEAGRRSEGALFVDRVRLRQDRQDWFIYEITRLETGPISEP
jgi:hypothetical protein